jgi:hypothetical protein
MNICSTDLNLNIHAMEIPVIPVIHITAQSVPVILIGGKYMRRDHTVPDYLLAKDLAWNSMALNITEELLCWERYCIHRWKHISPHISAILPLETNPGGYTWRLYWTNTDWGTYIVNDAGQQFDYCKNPRSIFYEIARAMGILRKEEYYDR